MNIPHIISQIILQSLLAAVWHQMYLDVELNFPSSWSGIVLYLFMCIVFVIILLIIHALFTFLVFAAISKAIESKEAR